MFQVVSLGAVVHEVMIVYGRGAAAADAALHVSRGGAPADVSET